MQLTVIIAFYTVAYLQVNISHEIPVINKCCVYFNSLNNKHFRVLFFQTESFLHFNSFIIEFNDHC